MLTTRVNRTAQRFTSSSTVSVAACTPYLGTTSHRPSHQRRRSSSKASCPPDSSKPTSTVTPPTSDTPALRAKKAGKTRRLAQEKTQVGSDKYNALPFVPQLHHLGEQDFGLSSFFALHRPLSITNPLPAPVSEQTFHSIFDQQAQVDPWANGNSAEQRPEDVVYALAKTIEAIDQATNAAQHDIFRNDSATDSADSTRHLDGTPQMRIPSLEDIIAQAKPYQVPPPPQAFPTAAPATERKRVSRSVKNLATRTKSYTTTITVVESEHANGRKTYEASVSPILRLPDAAVRDAAGTQNQPWTPYRTRKQALPALRGWTTRVARRWTMREPRSNRTIKPNVQKPQMLLISVKRQRKLKMKKHKYKKLMRRTRNLRRRMENK